MIRISSTPRFFNSFNTESQYFELSLSPTLIVRTSFLPSVLIPRITYAASLRITPLSQKFFERVLNIVGSLNIILLEELMDVVIFIIEDIITHYLQKKFHSPVFYMVSL